VDKILTSKLETLKDAVEVESKVLFAYLFGSQARKDTGPLSDLDIAVYLDETVEDLFSYRLRLIEMMMKILKDERVDIVVLNNANPLLRHEVMKVGIVLKENKVLRVSFEVKTAKDYLDTVHLRQVQLKIGRDKLKAGTYFG
jgi:uncharacterized protein